MHPMPIGRIGWVAVIAFWFGFALLVAGGRDADVWLRAVIWTGVALLSIATLGWWRWLRTSRSTNRHRRAGDAPQNVKRR